MEEDVCACCGGKFLPTGKRTRRTTFFTKWKGGHSAAETLEGTFGATVTPGRQSMLCMSCRQAIRSVDVKSGQLQEAEEKFRKIRKPGSYVAEKVKATPSKRKSPRKVRVVSTKAHLPYPQSPRKKKDGKVSITVSDTSVGRAVQHIALYKYKAGLRQLMKCSRNSKKAMQAIVSDEIRKEMKLFVNLCLSESSEASILNFDWNEFHKKAARFCPMTLEAVTAAVTKKQSQKSATKRIGSKVVSLIPVITAILNIMGFTRNRNCNIFQEMVSMMLWLSGCRRKVFKGLNSLGWCQSNTTTQRRIDEIRKDFDSKVLSWKAVLSGVENAKTETDMTEVEQPLPELEDVWEDVESDSPEPDSEVDSQLSSQLASCSITTSEEPSAGTTDHSESTSCESLVSEAGTVTHELEVEPETSSTFLPLYYDITFDNVNQKTSVRHHVRGKKNTMLNLVQAYATKERVGSFGLSNAVPTPEEIRNIPLSAFLPNDEDDVLLKEELGIMVSRTLTQLIPAFHGLEVVWSIPHKHSHASALKSDIVPLGVLHKDETKTADTIDILESYSQYVAKDLNGDPLSILLHCDGLSCERVHGAKKARINGEDIWARLGMFEPCIQEWHRRLMYIQDTYDELFKFESHREKGTLYNLKQVYNHTGVSKNVMQCFDKAEELLQFATDSYTVLFAMHLMGMESVDDQPVDYPKSDEDKKIYRDDIAEEIVDQLCYKTNSAEVIHVAVDKDVQAGEHCKCKLDVGGIMVYCANTTCDKGQWFHIDCMGMSEDDIPEGDWFCSDECESRAKVKRKRKKKVVEKFKDHKKEYVRRLLWRGLNAAARHDAVRENDGLRMIRHWKYDMFEFHEKSHPKYFIFGHRLLANVSGAASERVAHQLIWERTVNVRGGKGHNIPKDLHCEHLNREYKESSKASSGQLTEDTINRHSQMLDVGKKIFGLFEEVSIGSTKSYTKKHGRVDRSKDIKRMLRILQKENLFAEELGRSFRGFEDFIAFGGVKSPAKFKQRLVKHLDNMIELREVIMMQ